MKDWIGLRLLSYLHSSHQDYFPRQPNYYVSL